MKPKIIKKYENLNLEMIQDLKKMYPDGFKEHLTSFNNHKGEFITAIPFETEDYLYLIAIDKEFLGINDQESDDEEKEDYNGASKRKFNDLESELGLNDEEY